MGDEAGEQENKEKTKPETVGARKYGTKKHGNIGTREHGTRSWRTNQDTLRHQAKTENEICFITKSLGEKYRGKASHRSV